MDIPFAGLLEHDRFFLDRETATNSTGLLRAEIERQVLLAFVEETELSSLLGVEDRENAGNGLSEIMNLVQLRARRSDLLDAELTQFSLQLA